MKKYFFAALVSAAFCTIDGYAQQAKTVTEISTHKMPEKELTVMEYYSMFKGLAGYKKTVDPLCANNGYANLIKYFQALLVNASPAMKGDINAAITKAQAAQRKCPTYRHSTAQNISYSNKKTHYDAEDCLVPSAL